MLAMHRSLPPLLFQLSTSMALAAPGCPGPTAPLDEQFFAADCTECWAGTATPPSPATRLPNAPQRWPLHWIVPTRDEAAMAVAALPEAAQRRDRAALADRATAAAPGPQRRRAPAGWRLTVQSGPAWSDYIGAELSLASRPGAARWPAGSTAWLALVELVPAGSEGNQVPRALVRTVAGPLPVSAGGAATPTWRQMRALRWPANAKAERLHARAWVEGPEGQVLLMAADRCPPG
jgi:hypothetical protein